MCGIVAISAPAGGLQPADLSAPLRALSHRGPDGTGRWAAASGRTALGHARLAVIDRETGSQPISDQDGRYHLIAAGEFYGYEQIRAELAGRGRRLTTRSDSEIALHLYAESGWRALHRLRGEFAFAIWDDRRGELFAARDRFGIKPLFYAEHAGRFFLASEVKALLACGVPARWDAGSLADHLLVCYPPDRTLFSGIRQLPPGCYLRAGAGGARVGRYWDLDYPQHADLPDPEDAGPHLDDVRAAVEDAVRVRMRADVPVAYHLSGGVDSTSVVAIAAQAGRVPAFTVRFDDARLDETAVARRTADFLGADLTEVAVGREEFAARADQAALSGEMIQENSHGIARLLLSAAIRAGGFPVAMAGEGGDEMFAGYPQLAKDLAFAQSAEVRVRARRSYDMAGRHGLPPHLKMLLDELGFVPNWILDRYLNVTLPLLPLLRPGFARLIADRSPCADLVTGTHEAGQLRGRSAYHQSMYLFCKTWLCNYILAAERLDMASAVETRLPFLDHHVADVAKQTPLSWYVRDGVPKAALREAMRGYLPEQVYRGDKQGFFAPAAVQIPETLSRLDQVCASQAFQDQPFFDPVKVAGFFDQIRAEPPARRARHERLTQIITGTCLLAEGFGLDDGAGLDATITPRRRA
jgi:asparagine synthase (glutamine-hydrolysing)